MRPSRHRVNKGFLYQFGPQMMVIFLRTVNLGDKANIMLLNSVINFFSLVPATVVVGALRLELKFNEKAEISLRGRCSLFFACD